MRDLRLDVGRRAALALLAVVLAPSIPGAAEEAAERILVFGDSQAQGLAGGVLRLYRADRSRRVLDRSKISTGLTPRSSTDWPAQAKVLAAGERADVAVAMFGANDRPTVRRGGVIDPGLVDRFRDMYAPRVGAVAASFRQARVPLVWVGHPIVKDSAYTEDMALLNSIFAERAVAEGAVFLPTWDVFKGADGNFAPYGIGIDGERTRVRADDGVHMTPAGYDVLTAMLISTFEEHRPGARPAAPAPAPAVTGPIILKPLPG